MQSALAMLVLDAPLMTWMITRTAVERFLPTETLKRTSPSRPLNGPVP
jgi:hypothetical protein